VQCTAILVIVMGCGAGRNVVAPSRHDNVNNQLQAEEDSSRSRDDQQNYTDTQQKTYQVNKRDDSRVAEVINTQDSDVKNKRLQLEISEVNKQNKSSTEFSVKDSIVNKYGQQEMDDELESSECSKQPHIINKQAELCVEVSTNMQSDQDTSENSEDKQVKMCEQSELVKSNIYSVNQWQLIDKQHQEVVTMEKPVLLVEECNVVVVDKQSYEIPTNTDHTPPSAGDIDEGDNQTLLSVYKHSATPTTPELYVASQQVECTTHYNDHSVNQQVLVSTTHYNDHSVNQQHLHTTTPPLYDDTLLLAVTQPHGGHNLGMTQHDIPYLAPLDNTPPYTSPSQCGVAKSLSQSPRIVGLQLQLGFVNVTCAELDMLDSELLTTKRWLSYILCVLGYIVVGWTKLHYSHEWIC